MKKRGFEIGWGPLMYGALAIIIFFILFLIFQKQMSGQSKNLFDIGNLTASQAKGETCRAFFLGQYCSDKACDDKTDESVPGDFKDCKGQTPPKPYCCRKLRAADKEEDKS